MNLMEMLFSWGVPIIMTCLMAPVLSLLLAGLIAISRQLLWVPLMRSTYIANAERDGHVIRANLVESTLVKSRNGGYYQNTYEYLCNGVPKKYIAIQNLWRNDDINRAASEILLYYQKKPERACQAKSLGNDEWYFGRIFLITLLLCATGIFCFIKFYLVGQFF